MNWLVFAVVAWCCLGLELGLREVLRLGPAPVAPSFVVPLVVFVALAASPRAALWGALLLGLFTDLTWMVTRTEPAGVVTIVGPYAIGYVVAAQLVLSLRGMVIRRSLLTLSVLSVLAAAVAQVVVVAFLTVRYVYGDPIVWQPTSQLLWRLGSALYTALTGLAIGFVLLRMTPMFGFPAGPGARFARPR